MALGINSSVNMISFTFLFSDKDLGIQFLKGVGFICSKVPCNTCSCDMTWCTDPTTTRTNTFRWRCWRKVAEVKCSQSNAIKHGSWFQQSPHFPGGTVPHIWHCVWHPWSSRISTSNMVHSNTYWPQIYACAQTSSVGIVISPLFLLLQKEHGNDTHGWQRPTTRFVNLVRWCDLSFPAVCVVRIL